MKRQLLISEQMNIQKAYKEQFRQFTDDLLAHVQEKGNQVRLWGSLTARKGQTDVRRRRCTDEYLE